MNGGTSTSAEQGIRKILDSGVSGGTVHRAELVPVSGAGLPGFARVEYHLTPSPESFIRCELWLPLPENWNGRLWGTGNGGPAGGLPLETHRELLPEGNAVVTTDMGTSRGAEGKPAVWEDFGFRATHLMTVSAKRFAELFYGRAPAHSYFYGESTGGGQGFHEAQRFPEDFDGILSGVPAHARIPLYAYFLHSRRMSHDKSGKSLFTPEQYRTVAKAGIDFLAKEEPPYSAGKFLTDPGYTRERAEGILDLAVSRDPSLGRDGRRERLAGIFEGPVFDGKRAMGGVPFGTDISAAADRGLWCLEWFFGAGADMNAISNDDFNRFAACFGPLLNAENPDLGGFAGRGGRMIVFSGSRDAIVPYHSAQEYYERAAEANGGLDALRSFCRYYLLPGRDHNGGNGVVRFRDAKRVLVDWREKGIVPDLMDGVLADGSILPVAPYPMSAVETSGGWTSIRGKWRKTFRIDPLYTTGRPGR